MNRLPASLLAVFTVAIIVLAWFEPEFITLLILVVLAGPWLFDFLVDTINELKETAKRLKKDDE